MGKVSGRTIIVVLVLAAGFIVTSGTAWGQKKTTKVDTVALACNGSTQASIDIRVTAGSVTGAPAGFSIQWLTATQLASGADGIPGTSDDGQWFLSSDPNLCKGSFSGNANDSRYMLGAAGMVVVRVGDLVFDNGTSTNCGVALGCGTEYKFKAFAHATSTLYRSEDTSILTCSTQACAPVGDRCVLTQGFWRNHPLAWPVASLSLGDPGTVYSAAQLLSILMRPAAGNGLLTLAHQLIAAKLNKANGAGVPADVQADMDAADARTGTLVVPPVGTGFLKPSDTSALVTALDNYNSGARGVDHCR